MASTCEEITCAEGCASALPDVDHDLCNPDAVFGQISYLYITNVDYPLTDENSPSEWATRLALPASNPARIIRLIGIGDKPAFESTEVDMSAGRTVSGPGQHTVNFRIDEVNQTNYDFARNLQCTKVLKVWYKAFGGDAYGGAAGIDASVIFKHVIPEGINDLQFLQGTIKWKSKFDPCRFTHPLEGDNES